VAIVQLGNIHPHYGGSPIPGPTVTTVTLFGSTDIITDPNGGLWCAHSLDPAPAWVECPEEPAIAQAIADHYGCPVGAPEGVSR
jgi:hypothetical protein